ncbi:MAG: hypothetical protein WBP81_15170 [Solirubrobacteraceae bacterium]
MAVARAEESFGDVGVLWVPDVRRLLCHERSREFVEATFRAPGIRFQRRQLECGDGGHENLPVGGH